MPESDPAAEKELARLRRLPENRVCPNCFKEERLGFMAVCVRFRTFVCSSCKSAHQSFSHRCKDAAQSAWQMQEVRELDERRGGGNKAACRRWLANVPEGERPTESSSLDAFKRFVERAYIEERWAGTGDAEEEGTTAPAAAAEQEEGEGRAQRHRRHRKESGEDAAQGGRRRRHRSRRREREEAEGLATGWPDEGQLAWPGAGTSEGLQPPGFEPEILGWQGGPAGAVFGAAPPGPGEDAFGAYPGQCPPGPGPAGAAAFRGDFAVPATWGGGAGAWGAAAAWSGASASGSSPTNTIRAASDPFGWRTPSNSTDHSVYASPSASLSFGGVFADSAQQLKASPLPGEWIAPGQGAFGLGAPALRADATNPWADAPDLPFVYSSRHSGPSSIASASNDMSPVSLQAARRPWGPRSGAPQNEDAEHVLGAVLTQLPSPHIRSANQLVVAVDMATNPWAEDELRPKARASPASIIMGKQPVIGF